MYEVLECYSVSFLISLSVSGVSLHISHCDCSHCRESLAVLVAHRTNNRKVVGSRPTKVVCITVLTGNRLE